MRIEGLGSIETMGAVLTRELRPAEFEEVKDASGNVVSREQVFPALYLKAGDSFPWGWAFAGGALLFLVMRKPKGRR